MTKEVIVVLVILIVIILGNIFWMRYVDKSSNILLDILDKISRIEPEEDGFNDSVKELENEWEKQEKVWALAIEHKELDAIHLEIIGIKTMKEKEELNNKIENMRFLITHVLQMDKVLIKNIL